MRNDQRQRILVLRLHMDEVDVEPIDVGDEVGITIDPRLDLPPVVLLQPVIGELLDRIEPDALRVVVDGLALGPSRRGNPALEVVELVVRGMIAERPDRRIAGRSKDDRLFWLSFLRGGGLRRRESVRTAVRRCRFGHDHSPGLKGVGDALRHAGARPWRMPVRNKAHGRFCRALGARVGQADNRRAAMKPARSPAARNRRVH
jgi:hypothetical protein